jgi:hypothetical protein
LKLGDHGLGEEDGADRVELELRGEEEVSQERNWVEAEEERTNSPGPFARSGSGDLLSGSGTSTEPGSGVAEEKSK